ncbi:hypothetical protein P885DRAFT_59476 [Corynascus similis CBS 632.67]
MSRRPSSPGSSSHASGEYREIRLPNSRSVKALIYFCGRDPRKAKSVRRYHDDDFDTRSTGSGGSMFSWSSGTSQVYLVETTAPYWYYDERPDSASYSSSGRKRNSSRRGGTSRTSQRGPPKSTWDRHARVDDDDDDDSSSEGSTEDYDGVNPGPYPYPHPHSHPAMMSGGMPPPPGPPQGAFQPMYSYQPHATPQPTPAAGYHAPPPPPPPATGGMPPRPPGGHFVPGRGGVQVFVSD